MTETQERFLRTVLTRVPLRSVVEMHLFPSIRRGTLETGVAVIATVLPSSPHCVVAGPDALDGDIAAISPAIASVAGDQSLESYADQTMQIDTVRDDEMATAAAESSPYADELSEAGDIETDVVAPIPAPASRLRILTASYRHTIKGVERGKWLVEVQEEADAPLEAVEAVLRGVRHRSTEPADPERIGHDALEALIAPGAVAPAA